ncbi:MAG: quinolinate synthase [Myxococcales bacterium]|nr:quinolinate synthase [Myxococcales bacterium]
MVRMQVNQSVPLNEDVFDAIERVKNEKNAVILAHYYQDPDIQDLADHLGDSLKLAQLAQKSQADVILFCGVHFMAETAKILNPTRTVIIPDLNAGCSLADSCPAPMLKAYKAQHPDHMVVSYINCSAGVKALSDVICTSSNAEKIIGAIPEDKKILFTPDQHLGRYLMEKTGRDMKLWQGSCIVHEIFSEREILALKQKHPQADLIAHPECAQAILKHADHVGSTTSLLQYAAVTDTQELIVATEEGILHQMQKGAPNKTFIQAPTQEGCACNVCPHMRLNTLEKIYQALVTLEPAIEMEETLRLRAALPLERMLQITAGEDVDWSTP